LQDKERIRKLTKKAAKRLRTWPGFIASKSPPQKKKNEEKKGMAVKHLREAMLSGDHDVQTSLATHIQ